MRKIKVLRALGAAPAHTEHVACGDERVRANQDAARTEQALVSQFIDDAKVWRKHGFTAERGGVRAECCDLCGLFGGRRFGS